MAADHIHFVTGRLASPALEQVLRNLAPKAGFEYSIQTLNITVASLMTPRWIAARLEVPEGTTRVMLPGYCGGDLEPVQAAAGLPVERGPKDLRRLPEHFGRGERRQPPTEYDIEILAEINHAPRWALADIVRQAQEYARDGADLIDLGCNPGETWSGVAEVVKALRDLGLRVSIDSLNPAEIAPAVAAGAELVLSVNSSNVAAAPDWGCEVVVLPDTPDDLASLDRTVERLAAAAVPFRLDPVLEPIGFGFAASLARYADVRQRYPESEIMMGIGNLTELTDVDSAGVNVLLLGICQELGIRSVLTTQVINWARSSVRECDLARRLVHHAVTQRALPKHVEPRLVMLRDPATPSYGAETLDRLATEIRDHNVRVFAEQGKLHLLAAGKRIEGDEPFEAFARLQAQLAKPVDAAHAFYLGYELAKATTALTLGKDYRQDEALDWGFLTRPEQSHLARRKAGDAAADSST
jgi:dihydropteroate synthase-like protein